MNLSNRVITAPAIAAFLATSRPIQTSSGAMAIDQRPWTEADYAFKRAGEAGRNLNPPSPHARREASEAILRQTNAHNTTYLSPPKPNNFCPCGSGRKYRSCCVWKEKGPRMGPTDAEIAEIAAAWNALPEEEKQRLRDGNADCRTIGPF